MTVSESKLNIYIFPIALNIRSVIVLRERASSDSLQFDGLESNWLMIEQFLRIFTTQSQRTNQIMARSSIRWVKFARARALAFDWLASFANQELNSVGERERSDKKTVLSQKLFNFASEIAAVISMIYEEKIPSESWNTERLSRFRSKITQWQWKSMIDHLSLC